MISWLEVVTLCINLVIIYAFANIFLVTKKIDKRLLLKFSSISIVGMLIYYLFLGISVGEAGLILSILFILVICDDKMISKIFVLAFYFLLTYSLEIFIAFSAAIISGSTYNDFFTNRLELYNLTLTLFTLLIILIYKYLARIKAVRENIILNNLSNREIAVMTVVLSASFVFTILIDLMLTDAMNMEFNIPITFLLFTLFMASLILIGILVIVQKNYKEHLLSSNNKLLEIQLNSQLDHYNQLEKSLVETRKIKHDMQNHMSSLRYLINKDAHDEALNYIGDIDNKLSKIASSIDTGNVIFDAIFIEKNEFSRSKGINIVNVKCKNYGLKIGSVDLCTIVANSMDNAVEACVNLKDNMDKEISIESYVNNGFWIYRIVNTAEEVVIKNNSIITSKEDKTQHGFGIPNIKETVEKYDGMFDIHYDNGKFVLEVVMRNKA